MSRQVTSHPAMCRVSRLLINSTPNSIARQIPHGIQRRYFWGRRYFQPSPYSLARGMFEHMEEDMRQMERQVNRLWRFRPHELESIEALSESQITTKEDGSKHVHLNFNVKDFKPEEILIKFDRTDKSLFVSGHHESLQEGQHVTRNFSKVFRLPSSVESESMTSSIKDGVLTIGAPLKNEGEQISRIVDIPIEKLG